MKTSIFYREKGEMGVRVVTTGSVTGDIDFVKDQVSAAASIGMATSGVVSGAVLCLIDMEQEK